MEQSFAGKPDLPMRKYPNLRESCVLGRLEILLANRCNLNCRYCYAHGGDYGTEEQVLTPELAQKYLRALILEKYTAVDVVVFFGGEPTMAPDTIQTICEFFEQYTNSGALEKMPVFTMVTNGTLIHEALVRTLRKYKVRVTVSVDGPPEINDRLRVDKVGNGTFSRIEHGIRLLREAGIPPKTLEATYTTLHKKMGYTRQDIRRCLQERFDMDSENIIVADCESNGYDDTLAFRPDEVPEEKNLLPVLHFRRLLARGDFCDLSCLAGIQPAVLFPNGDIYPCHHFFGQQEFTMAHFDGSSFDFSNYPSVLQALEPSHKTQNTSCNDCCLKGVCHICPAAMLGRQKLWDEAGCESVRTYYKKLFLSLAKQELGTSKIFPPGDVQV